MARKVVRCLFWTMVSALVWFLPVQSLAVALGIALGRRALPYFAGLLLLTGLAGAGFFQIAGRNQLALVPAFAGPFIANMLKLAAQYVECDPRAHFLVWLAVSLPTSIAIGAVALTGALLMGRMTRRR